MNIKKLNKNQKLSISAMAMASYIVIMYLTQSFSFGAYQIRIATSIYALAYFFPFLVLPLGLANFMSNWFFGGLGIYDWIGGAVVGIIVTLSIVLIRRMNLNKWFIAIPIILGPGLLVPVWLSQILGIPYSILATSVLIGQIIPGLFGAYMIKELEKRSILNEGEK